MSELVNAFFFSTWFSQVDQHKAVIVGVNGNYLRNMN